jgi:hypothetical protein
MSRDKIAGFMIGISAGYVMGYLIKHPVQDEVSANSGARAGGGGPTTWDDGIADQVSDVTSELQKAAASGS